MPDPMDEVPDYTDAVQAMAEQHYGRRLAPSQAPQQPGNVTINLAPGQGSIDIDGYPIDQHVVSMKLLFDAKHQRPVLLLDLHPSAVNLNAARVIIDGPFRDFLIAHGWQPPQ